MLTDIQAIVLAAGRSRRFNTGRTKLVEKICGQEMVLFSTKLLEELDVPTTVVIGHHHELVKEVITKHHSGRVQFVYQEDQLGTGHALMCSRPTWQNDHILILNADAPLLTSTLIETLARTHRENNATISFITAHNADPAHNYGRVITCNGITRIVEARNFDGDPHEHCCINAGVYLIERAFLEKYINSIACNDASNEFYLTDLVEIASMQHKTVSTVTAPYDRVRGINTFQELWAAEQIKRAELIRYWMERGVRFSSAQTVHIDLNVSIESGSFIGCSAHLLGHTTIGKDCTILPFSTVENSTLEDNVTIDAHSIVRDSTLRRGAYVGPFAHIRDHSIIGETSSVGNFVEIKKSSLGTGTKAKHLNYLGDATIGNHVNIGAGTITCNHDGNVKHKTIIHDNAYIGSNNSLVAPVTIGHAAFTGAGSVITEDVPDHALAIARARQINKEQYAQQMRDSQAKKKSIDEEETASFIAATKLDNETQTFD